MEIVWFPWVILRHSIQLRFLVVIKAWQISRHRFIENLTDKAAAIDLETETTEIPSKISWNKDAQPGQSILKKQDSREEEKPRAAQRNDITHKLDEIGKSLEKLSNILLHGPKSKSMDVIYWKSLENDSLKTSYTKVRMNIY